MTAPWRRGGDAIVPEHGGAFDSLSGNAGGSEEHCRDGDATAPEDLRTTLEAARGRPLSYGPAGLTALVNAVCRVVSVVAVSRPRHPLARVCPPLTRKLQHAAVRRYVEAMGASLVDRR